MTRKGFTKDNPAYQAHSIGEYTYGSPVISNWATDGKLIIGKFCSIASGVLIELGGEHRIDWLTTYPFPPIFKWARKYPGHPASKGDVVIHNDVWIGYGASIFSGVTIDNGAVIGARAVVAGSKHIGPYEIWAGNPARFIRCRFEADEISAMERIAWWDWPIEQIADSMPLLLSNNIEEFVARYG